MPKPTKEITPPESQGVHNIVAARVRNTPVGLEIDPLTSYEEWLEIYGLYSHLREQSRWSIGDCLNFAEKHFPDRYAQAIDTTGKSYSRLTSYAGVCSRIEQSRRRVNVSFDAHEAVAYIPAQEADKILAKAEKLGWTRDDVRDQVCIVNGLPTKAEREQQKRIAAEKKVTAARGKIIEVESTTIPEIRTQQERAAEPPTQVEAAAIASSGENAEQATPARAVKRLASGDAPASPSQGWTGNKCPRCKGHGQIKLDDGEEGICPSCAGTGDEYGQLSSERQAREILLRLGYKDAPAIGDSDLAELAAVVAADSTRQAEEADPAALLAAFVATIPTLDVKAMTPLQKKAWIRKLLPIDRLIDSLQQP